MINLTPDVIDCIVFWTKNPKPMLDKLYILDERGYDYYFQFTITSYQSDVESGIKNKNDIINTFKILSNKIGKKRVVWRYDPIFINDKYTLEYHELWFDAMCKRLSGYTEKCVISFLDFYTKTQRNTKELQINKINDNEIRQIAKSLSKIAKMYNLELETCSEGIDLSEYGITHGKCIDDKLISQIVNSKINVDKDDTQREVCGCVKSIDIGQYNTCKHFCKYCYANYNYALVNENCESYSVDSPLLISKLKGDEKITVREMKSYKCNNYGEQIKLPFLNN
jgi:hypothetical protein